MESYSAYKKISRPYFNLKELLAIPVLPLLVLTVISYGIIYFGGISIAIFFHVIASIVINYHFHGLKNAFSNHSNKTPSKSIPGIVVLMSMMPSFLVILGGQLVATVGSYLFVLFQKTGVFYKTYFLLWIFIVFGLPTLYFLGRELKYWFTAYYQAYYFTTLSLTIDYDPDLLISIEEISFLNTRKRFKSTFLNTALPDFHKKDEISETHSIAEYNERFYKPILIKSIAIPKQSNVFKIIYTSHLEETNYQEELAFPFEKLYFEQEKYPTNKSKFLRGKKSEKVILSLQKGGILQLYTRQEPLIKPIQLIQKTQSKKVDQSVPTPENGRFPGLEDLSANKQLYKRMAIKNRLFNWQITGTVLEDHEVRVKDVKNYLLEDEIIETDTIKKRPLPLSFEFTYEYYQWLTIHVDSEKLFDQMLPAQLNDPDSVFKFEISIDLLKGKVDVKLSRKGVQLLFSAWEREIKSHRWKDAKNKLLKKQKQVQQQLVLSQIYDLMQQTNYTLAQKVCQQQIQSQPNFAMLYFYEARLLFYTQGYEACYLTEEYFIEKTKEDAYTLSRIYNHYGCLLDEEERHKEALPYFEKAYNTYANEIMYLANIAEIYYKLNRIKQAIHYAKECINKGYDSDFITKVLSQKHT
ncbi:hypothetical protein GCM10011506_35220 [Marivirga lumbricoides]|uniref:Tetratricopeptide repeat protein n=1 Tax=Marivirga lumbricoides TaxID=1046115 RepID=A0ABQ1MT79_9BACT|nr:hypothetical protein GCM10011506_35220 [Marivirga lumbricoides]